MTKKDYETLVNCVEQRKRDNDDEFYCLKDNTPEDIKRLLQDAVYENDQHDFDLNYEMLNDALNELNEVEFEDLARYDVYDSESEFASVYTAVRLGYLSIWNQDEITEKLKECECDIQTACAVWYDEQVKQLIQTIKDKIIEGGDEK